MLSVVQSLMVAIVKRGMADLESPYPRVRSGARAWFLARKTEGEYVFAFARICREFGGDPRVIRARIFTNLACEPALSSDRQRRRQPLPTAPPTPAPLRVAQHPGIQETSTISGLSQLRTPSSRMCWAIAAITLYSSGTRTDLMLFTLFGCGPKRQWIREPTGFFAGTGICRPMPTQDTMKYSGRAE